MKRNKVRYDDLFSLNGKMIFNSNPLVNKYVQVIIYRGIKTRVLIGGLIVDKDNFNVDGTYLFKED